MIFSRRKWGWYLTLLASKQFKVKLLYFRSGHALSMQKHNHRRELWLYLSGYGIMYLDQTKHFGEIRHAGESSIIDRGQWHQFCAERRTLVLEVQFGGGCREGDIERI